MGRVGLDEGTIGNTTDGGECHRQDIEDVWEDDASCRPATLYGGSTTNE